MTGTTSALENYMLVSTRYDILEMNVVARYKDGVPVYSVAVRRGGHIQPILGTECKFVGDADILLGHLAEDLKSGKWELGTQDARPILKRAV
tara:strand:- start:1 stop:276 length:276 start_codon:yes stop_codon:yes gene_type:complete